MRKSGILMHISSLPSPYGIGTLGKEAREFIDFLKESGQSYWQLLPICPTSYGDSPYQSYSTFAGNPYFIDLDMLAEEGLLYKEEYANIDWESKPEDVNYGALYQKRYPVLNKATERFLAAPPNAFAEFCEEQNAWLDNFATFMTLKDVHNGASWWEWDVPLRNYEPDAVSFAQQTYQKEIMFWKAVQYLFFEQWNSLKAYAKERGIEIIGDLPIYVSLDSVDVWSDPKLFQLNEEKIPTEVAGCPPDGFSADGQLWGNPLYDWDYMEKDNYKWWVNRIDYLCNIYDVLRIDHFRGFEAYYAIPYGSTSAINGVWKKGPGMKLFSAVEQSIGEKRIIAEDLGFLTEEVYQLLRDSGFPGMKVLEFAFDSRDESGNVYLPHNYIKNCVAYTGTHDNEPILGWMETADPLDVAYAKEYLELTPEEGYHWGMMRGLFQSVADLTIVQAQDILGLGSESRMNTPSTVGKNWRWRVQKGVFTPGLAQKLQNMMALSDRLPK